jgi:hypothetical protein
VVPAFSIPVRVTFTTTPVDVDAIQNEQLPPDSNNPDTNPPTVRVRPSTLTAAIVTVAAGALLRRGVGDLGKIPVDEPVCVLDPGLAEPNSVHPARVSATTVVTANIAVKRAIRAGPDKVIRQR